ncbi:Ankyrin repeats (many copies)/Ankyrin repeats (3 copies)/Ankyrin repeat [Lotmaria passim]
MLASSFRITDLLQAVIQGDLSAVMESVNAANVNYTDPQYRLSLVMWAVTLGRLPTAEVLISRGASLFQLDRYGFTIVHRAVWSADVATLHMVLFQTPRAAASQGGYAPPTQPSSPPRPTAATASGARPAAEQEEEVNRESAHRLSWRPNAQRLVNAVHAPTGRTPLMLAAVRGHTDIVRFLLNTCGADPFQKDHNGFAAIDLAALCGHVEMVRLLLQLSVAANGDGCGDGAAFTFPSTQRRAEDYCEVAQTLPQRQRLFAVNELLNENLAEASRVAAA